MARTSEAIPNPELLVWSRKSAAMKLDTAAEKLKIDPERLDAWEQGEQRPTIAQLRNLGNLYKRPIAVFYLPEAPQLPPHLRDFRRLPGTPDEFDAVNIAREARIARERREIFLELAKDVDQPLPDFPHHASLTSNPEQLAQKIRDILDISLHEQTSISGSNNIFNFWRNRIETTGALVFQSITVELASMRGFSITEFPLPVIVVNRKDTPKARVFTMLHEFVHLLLHIGGTCDLDQRPGRPPEEQKIEVFCNHVAGATLVPQNNLLNTDIVKDKDARSHWHDDEFAELAKHFGVSREVITRRLLILGRISDKLYEKKRKAYQKEYQNFKEVQKKKKEGRGPSPAINAVSAAGKPYIRTVLSAFHANKITLSDVSDYLGVRLKHLSRIEQAVGFG